MKILSKMIQMILESENNFESRILVQWDLDLRKLDLRKNLDLRKILQRIF